MVMSAVFSIESSGRCETTLTLRLPPVFTPGITSVRTWAESGPAPSATAATTDRIRNFMVLLQGGSADKRCLIIPTRRLRLRIRRPYRWKYWDGHAAAPGGRRLD